MNDQAKKLREMVEKNQETVVKRPSGDPGLDRARVITITSGKGGVGKSNLAVNLGISLASRGHRVTVVDMDLGLANVNVITDSAPQFTLLDVFEGRRGMEEVMEEGPGGIQIIAGASGEEQLANLSRNDCRDILQKLGQLDEWMDFLVVDTSAGLSERVLQFVCAADDTLLVTTPEPTAITDAYAIMKAGIRRQPPPNFHLIINRASTIIEAKRVGEKMTQVGQEYLNVPLDILGFMVEDQTVARAVRKRRPFLLEYPNAKVSRCVEHLSERLIRDDCQLEPRGIQQFFSRVMGWFS